MVEGVPPEYDYEKIECTFQGMRDYAKFIKRGYGRANHLLSIDIRNSQIDREAALSIEQEYDGKRPASIEWFLNILQITEEEFYELLEKHQVAHGSLKSATLELALYPQIWKNGTIQTLENLLECLKTNRARR